MDTNEKIRVLIDDLQPGADAELVSTNFFGGTTYRLQTGDTITYLKVAPDSVPVSHDLTVEAERVRWVRDRFAVPQVLGSGHQDGFTWLLTAQLAGVPATDERWKVDHHQTAVYLGRAVRAFHDALAPYAGQCPWSWRIADRSVAGQRSAEATALLRTAPSELDLVVSHGDLCAPNVLLHPNGQPAGVVDLGKLGVADRAADLGSQVWSLEFNGMADQGDTFLDAYDYGGDPAHVTWYRDYYAVV